MPVYQYRCMQCQHFIEQEHGMLEKPLVVCPACGGLTEKCPPSTFHIQRLAADSEEAHTCSGHDHTHCGAFHYAERVHQEESE